MSKVSNSTLGSNGLVAEWPEALAAQAGLDVQTYTLARVIASEEGSSPRLHKVAVGWAVMNEAARKNQTLMTRVTNGSGQYGAQNASTGARYVSTARDPSTDDVEVARAILTGREPDPTGGCHRFFAPAAQDALVASGKAKYTMTADEIIAKWTKEGQIPVAVAGIDFRKLAFFRWPNGARWSAPSVPSGILGVLAAAFVGAAGAAWFAVRKGWL